MNDISVSAFLYQTGTPVLIVTGGLLLLFLLLFVYAAMVVSSRADEQMERDWTEWCQSHPDSESKADGSGV